MANEKKKKTKQLSGGDCEEWMEAYRQWYKFQWQATGGNPQTPPPPPPPEPE